jgi:hypothetical protein
MSVEQQQNLAEQQMLEAKWEREHVTVSISEAQLTVIAELDLDRDKVVEIAQNAFDSQIRGKLQASIDRAIKAKYLAESRGKKNTAADCEEAIQRGLRLKREL